MKLIYFIEIFEAPLQMANRDLKREIQKELNSNLNPI
jgi:hypothetical protein